MDRIEAMSKFYDAAQIYNAGKPIVDHLVSNDHAGLLGSAFDSIGLVEFLLIAENTFDMNFKDIDDRSIFKTVGSFLDYVTSGAERKPKLKLIITDLDDTLWRGTADDDVTVELNKEYFDKLMELEAKGVLLAICSKNDLVTVGKTFKKLKIDGVTIDKFSIICANWNNKPSNIKDILHEMQIDPADTLFVDDSAFERDFVRANYPSMLAIHPDDFNSWVVDFETYIPTKEDRERTKLYLDEKRRKELQGGFENVDEWLFSLGMQLVPIRKLTEEQFERCVQLLNRSNQMNLNKRPPITSEEIQIEFAEGSLHDIYGFQLSDKIGNSGIIGVITTLTHKSCTEVIDFALSCRVIGRKVENAILSWLFNYKMRNIVDEVNFNLKETDRNMKMQEFILTNTIQIEPNGRHFIRESNRPPEIKEIEICELQL